MSKKDKFQNNSLQDNLPTSYKLSHKIEQRYTQFPRSDFHRFIRKGFGIGAVLSNFHLAATESKYSFYDEIAAKYSLGEMCQFSDSLMVYKRLGSAFSETYLNALVTFPLSLTFAQMVEMKSLALWYSPVERWEIIREVLKDIRQEPGQLSRVLSLQTQTVEALYPMTGSQFQLVSMLPSERHAESYEARPPSMVSPGFTHVRNVERGARTWHADERLQQARPVSRKDGHAAEAMTLVNFWHWFHQRHIVNTSETWSLAQRVFVQNMLLPNFIAGDQRPQQRTLTGIESSAQDMMATLKPIPAGHQTTKLLKTIVDERTLHIMNERLIEGSAGRATSAVADGVTNEIHQFAIIRKAQQMEPPSLNYAFAQPMRPIAREERVISKVEEKEVVKLVQKEIQSYMSSGTVKMNFSRSDYARITDSIYTSLTRRLMVEKERLGIR